MRATAVRFPTRLLAGVGLLCRNARPQTRAVDECPYTRRSTVASALLAILRAESEARTCADAIERSAVRRISAGNYLEAAVLIDASRDPIASRRLDELLQAASTTVEPVTEEQARVGREAYRDIGKGSGHPALLNYGDCFAYALAKTTGEPLLFKGNDFAQTDVAPAIPYPQQ